MQTETGKRGASPGHVTCSQLHSGSQALGVAMPNPTQPTLERGLVMATQTKQRRSTPAEVLAETPPAEVPAVPTPAEVLAMEAEEHAAFLVKVREQAYTRSRDWGICSSGRNAFLRDTGIPFVETARYGNSVSQPAITVDPFNGLNPSWFTDDGMAGLIESQRAKYAAQRSKVARGILRAHKQGYGSSEQVAEVLTELGLETPPAALTAVIRLGDYTNITVAGITPGTTSDQVADAFREMVARNLGLYLPGWQTVKVTDGFDVIGLTESYVVPAESDDHWTF